MWNTDSTIWPRNAKLSVQERAASEACHQSEPLYRTDKQNRDRRNERRSSETNAEILDSLPITSLDSIVFVFVLLSTQDDSNHD